MCGIIGIFNDSLTKEKAKIMLLTIKNRGKDGYKLICRNNHALGHCLHSLVGFVHQPIKRNGWLSSNCEIYNWQELAKKHHISSKNDSQLLLYLLEKNGIDQIKETLKELDGPFAFAYWQENRLWLARDLLGIKPLWYSWNTESFYFASEKKALEKIGCLDIQELNPRHILIYDIRKKAVSFIKREFFRIGLNIKKKQSLPKIKQELARLVEQSVSKRLPQKKFGILFSGGVDSSLIAFLAKKLGKNFICYTSAVLDKNFSPPEDLAASEKAAQLLGIKLKVKRITLTQVEKYLKTVVPLVEDSNVVKVGVGLTIFAACELAKKDKVKVIFSGLGSEELFAGYQRHKNSSDINKECLSGLLKVYERDTYRDDVITMYNQMELRVPFLDNELVRYALTIPGEYKIKESIEKWILRQTAREMGLPEEICQRKKKAAQYGSGFDKALDKLARRKGFKTKSEYLHQFYPAHNLNLGVLFSTGKDSNLALHIMRKQNYHIKTLITLRSKNPDSFMFHTPAIDLAKLQAEALDIPLMEIETLGEENTELKDLERAISLAKEEHRLDGIVTGALFSNYQRERIEKICDKLGLKIFSPLWHKDQETELKELLKEGFEFVMVRVAADGLSKEWLNRKLGEKEIDELIKLSRKYGINPAGEGGEYESLVLFGPGYKKRIRLMKTDIISEGAGAYSLAVKKAQLEETG